MRPPPAGWRAARLRPGCRALPGGLFWLWLTLAGSAQTALTTVPLEPAGPVLAGDDASNYTNTWSGNGGVGFEPWYFETLDTPVDPPRAYLAFTNTHPGLTTIGTPPDGAAWGLDANPGLPCYIMAIRPFPANGLNASGQTFAVSMACGAVGSNAMAAVGVQLRRSEGFSERERVELSVLGGKSTYTVIDAAGQVDTGINIHSGGVRLVFTLTGPDTYELHLNQAGDGTPIGSVTGTMDNWGIIDEVLLYNASAGTNHVYFNSLAINGAPMASSTTTTTTTSTSTTTTSTTSTTTTAEPFYVVAVDPPNAAVAAPLAGPVAVTFSDVVDPATVNANTFRVHGRQSGLRRGTFLADPVRFVPDRPFHPGEWIDVTLTAGVRATNGASLRPYQWSFTTRTLGSTNFSFVREANWGGSMQQRPAMGDLDGDGDLDAWVACRGDDDYIWINDGDGTFAAGQEIPRPFSIFYYPFMDHLLGDINGDGRLDGLPLNPEPREPLPDPGLVIWTNTGNGTFSASTQHVGTAWGFGYGLLRDLDADGNQDALVSHEFSPGGGEPTNILYRNDGFGNLDNGETVTILATGRVDQIVTADLDTDGDTDLVCAGVDYATGSGYTLLIISNADGAAFIPSQQLALTNFSGGTVASLGDVDGDGDYDAVLGDYDGRHVILKNDGEGIFTPAGQIDTGEHTTSPIGLADIDGDGDLDAVIAPNYQAGGPGRVMVNDGSGHFATSEVLLVGEAWWMDVADIDQDGDLDLVYGGVHPTVCRHMSLSEVGAELRGPEALGAGQPFAYTIAYSNNGPVGARALSITAALPVSHLDVQGVSATGMPAPVLDTNAPALTWRLGGVLAAGQGGTLTVTGSVYAAAASGAVTAQIMVAVAEIDDEASNNTDAKTIHITASPPLPDTDGDRIPDGWEVAHGLDPGVSNAPDANADGDPFSDWEEYVADSDPTNPAAYFAITAISNGAAWTVFVDASTARVYLLEGAADLSASAWVVVPGQSNVPGATAQQGLSDTNATSFRGYRVGVNLP